MHDSEKVPRRTAVPAHSAVMTAFPEVDLIDSYAISLPAGATTEPLVLARHLLSRRIAWVDALMVARDLLVSAFALKTSADLGSRSDEADETRIGLFSIYGASRTELVLGEDDKHLDFRLSLLCLPPSGLQTGTQLVLSSAVHCHNTLGRVYLTVVAPFHRLIVPSLLRRAACEGWPPQD